MLPALRRIYHLHPDEIADLPWTELAGMLNDAVIAEGV